MEPMNLLVARKAVADDMRNELSAAGYGQQRRTTRITRHRVTDLFRRAVTALPRSTGQRSAAKAAAAPRVVSQSSAD